MQIIINTPDEDPTEYLAVVHGMVQEGFTSGLQDSEHHWDIISDRRLAAISEQISAYLYLSNEEALPEADLAAYQAIESLVRLLGIPMPRAALPTV